MTGELYIHPKTIEISLLQAEKESEALRKTPEYKAQQAAELAAMCKEWRGRADLSAPRAAEVLGIPRRTYEGIEQGRGFPYPVLLALAIRAFE